MEWVPMTFPGCRTAYMLVIPAQAGTQCLLLSSDDRAEPLGSGFRRDDGCFYAPESLAPFSIKHCRKFSAAARGRSHCALHQFAEVALREGIQRGLRGALRRGDART